MLEIIICLITLIILVVVILLYIGYSEFKYYINRVSIESIIKNIEKQSDYVNINDISKWMTIAVVSIEDHRFYNHFGIDIIAIGRAFIYNFKNKKIGQGGSTITQQLCKNIFFTQSRTIKRKIGDALAAIYMEKHYSKYKILELYLNIIYFGNGYYGINEASQGYYGVSPKNLSLNQATMLAGIIQAPNVYNINNQGLLEKKRQKKVLLSMIKYKNKWK